MDWWEPSTKASYLRKASCIIEQYGAYKIPHLGLPLNGINTQGENIADNGGIKEAYRAYSEWRDGLIRLISDLGPVENITGLALGQDLFALGSYLRN